MAVPSQQILLIDNDSDLLLSLAQALKASGLKHNINVATSSDKALTIFRELRPQVVVLDLSLDDRIGPESGFAVLKEITALDPTARVIVLTGHGAVEFGIKALELGASNFLVKPPEIPHLLALIKDALAQSDLRRAYIKLKQEVGVQSLNELVGSSVLMRAVREAISYAAQTNQAVLITGETGTGKGLCAQLIHRESSRHDKNFVRYQPNFATADLVNSDLFGHIKGSFTGANETRRGLLNEAHAGSLFLDEIDELPLETQVTLLGVLQDKRFRPLGSDKEEGVDFRLICATNQEIERSVESGKLRKDLFHRIAHFRIELPALRDRKGDIPELVESILSKMRLRERISVFEINSEALSKLTVFEWPGNIRELEAVIEGASYAAQFANRTVISAQDLKLSKSSSSNSSGLFHEQVEKFKLSLIQEALNRNGSNQVQAARELGLDRSSMRRILTQK